LAGSLLNKETANARFSSDKKVVIVLKVFPLQKAQRKVLGYFLKAKKYS
jgi:hypothetical protein